MVTDNICVLFALFYVHCRLRADGIKLRNASYSRKKSITWKGLSLPMATGWTNQTSRLYYQKLILLPIVLLPMYYYQSILFLEHRLSEQQKSTVPMLRSGRQLW